MCMGVLFTVIIGIYESPTVILAEGDDLYVEDISRVNHLNRYDMISDEGHNLIILSSRNLGYAEDDTLKFLGRIPQCTEYKWKNKLYRPKNYAQR